jgi:hypothetical protein
LATLGVGDVRHRLDGRRYARRVHEEVADRVFKELEADGYEPRLHPVKDEPGLVEIRLRGHDYDLDDLKAMVRAAETFGVGLKLDANGWLTLR